MAGLAGILAYGAGLLAIVAMAATTIRQLRYAMLLAGVAALAHFALTGEIGWAVVAFAFVAVNGVQISVLRRRARRGAMLEEEASLFGRLLGIEEPGRQQRLRDLMVWRDVEAGEVLMRQDQPDPPLIYVARGGVHVECDGRMVGTSGPEEFLGEMSLVSGQTASATVIVAERSRVATFDRDALAHYARAVPEVDTALTHALNRGLAAKVRRMNEAASHAPGENAREA